MKALNSAEIKSISDFAHQTLAGAKLQSILLTTHAFAMGFYTMERTLKWLIFFLDKNSPFLWVFDQNKISGPKLKKPLSLFIETHFVGLTVSEVKWIEKWERVIELRFANTDAVIELRAIPKQINIGAHIDKKEVWLEKPLSLKEHSYEPQSIRSLNEIFNQWELEQKKDQVKMTAQSTDKDQKDTAELIKKNLEKKKKALQLVQQQVDDVAYLEWQNLGEELKMVSSYEQIQSPLKNELKLVMPISQNMELCFQKAKLLKGKREGAKFRLEQLQREIQQLESGVLPQSSKPQLKQGSQGAAIKQRRLNLPSGLIATFGKSAKDNLSLLRKAKPWDLWMHLRDYPGSHVIIHRNKSQVISDEELKLVAEWLIKETVRNKDFSFLDVILTECRFVTPIKGDRLGRVNYHSEKNIRIHFASSQAQ